MLRISKKVIQVWNGARVHDCILIFISTLILIFYPKKQKTDDVTLCE